ncbi:MULTISPECIES: hypothetical protein [Bradyrhizobium]|uniref:hypothetical protein n=1 Tax=Bradyrhizobium elkanii TaxID=29448 RepID=UPI0004049BDB|nr:hypothetical protein [Bradyrhizobium elkanii]
MQKLEANIASLAKQAGQLAAKRATAQQALDKAISDRRGALLSVNLDDRQLNKLQAAVDTATSILEGIDDAISILKQQQVEAERQLAAERDAAERAAAAEKLAAQITAIEAELPKYLKQSRAFADALSAIGRLHFETGQLMHFVQNVVGQIEIAANFALADLKTMPIAIRAGQQAIPRDEPKPEAVPDIVDRDDEKVTPPSDLAPVVASEPTENFIVLDRSSESRTIKVAGPDF